MVRARRYVHRLQLLVREETAQELHRQAAAACVPLSRYLRPELERIAATGRPTKGLSA